MSQSVTIIGADSGDIHVTASDISLVRLLVADTASAIWTDVEIQSFLDAEGGIVKLAAALACESLSVDRAKQAKAISSGQFSENLGAIPAQLRLMADSWRKQVTATGDGEDEAYWGTVEPTVYPWENTVD